MSLKALNANPTERIFSVMDGAMGTEVRDRGIELVDHLWSATPLLTSVGRETVLGVHVDSINAGAELITANTFRTQERTFQKVGLDGIGTRMTIAACNLANKAIISTEAFDVTVAGSAGPIEDCYTPSATPSQKEILTEHAQHAENLATGEVDIIVAETMITLRETAAALKAATDAGLPVAVSFCCDKTGRNLLSGESLRQAVKLAEKFEPLFIGVNCVDIHTATRAVRHLAGFSIERPIAVYAQGEDHESPVLPDKISREIYLNEAERWCQLGARVIGGCCGVPPSWIRGLSDLVPDKFYFEPTEGRLDT